MPTYLDNNIINEMNEARKEIFKIRADIYKKHKIDLLDTDALSALSIYEIVNQYDPDYNINLARNGEDAKSKNTLIEQKACRVEGPLTKTGKTRKNAGSDGCFLFHAMGDIKHSRYLFVARNKDTLTIERIYDIGSSENCEKIYQKLLSLRNEWLQKGLVDQNKMKRDVISINETFLLGLFPKPNYLTIDNVKILKDW